MSSLSDAMQTLTAQYINALITQLNLSADQFQLTQGEIALDASSQALWAYLDAIPPDSLANNWSPGGQNTFSSQYGDVISRLKDAGSTAWQQSMGDWLPAWETYLKANPCPATQTMAGYFRNWALASGMPPTQAQQAASLYSAALNGPIFQANEAYAAAGGQTGVKAYTQTIESATHAIMSNAGKTVSFDSATESSDVSHTWAATVGEGFIADLFGGGDASYDDVASRVISAGLDISIAFTHIATIPAIPLSQGTVTAGPSTYSAWYVPAALSSGYTTNNNEVWQDGTPGWANFFGPGGSFPRATQAIILVDGISVTMTSRASFDESDQTTVQTAFGGGFFPFFEVEGHGGWSSSTVNFDQGQVTVTQSSPIGNPQVLGILQTPLTNLVAAEQLTKAILSDRRRLRDVKPDSTIEIVDPERPDVMIGVSVNWTPGAYAAMQAAHPNPGVQQVVFVGTNNWAANNAPTWAVGAMQQYLGATAQRVVTPGGGIGALISAYH